MKKSSKLKIACSILLNAVIFGSFSHVASLQNTVETKAFSVPSTTYVNGDKATYYNSISATAEGDTLLSALRSLNSSKKRSTFGYKSMGTSIDTPYIYTDYDPNNISYDSNGQPYGSKILSFYSGTAVTSFNKEHVWPSSKGGNYVENDLFMPRPSIQAENSNRGNSDYVTGVANTSSGWDPITAFGESGCYQGTSIRGECARIIFYCMTASSNLHLEDSIHTSSNPYFGKLSDLLKWNLDNPVNQREINRNEGGEYLQGNRNAFVDHPEYACKIWGNTNATTKSICAGQLTTKELTKITLTAVDSENFYVSEGRYITLKATGTYSDSSTVDLTNVVNWTSSNTNYATVSGGKVTGVAGSAGGQYVNITASYDGISGTHGVYVWTSGEYGTLVNGGSDSGDSGDSSDINDGEWTLLTDAADLVAGREYVIASNSNGKVATSLTGEYLGVADATFSSDKKTITTLPDSAAKWTLGGSSNAWTLTDENGKLGATAVKKLSAGNGTTTWKITPSSTNTTIANTNSGYGSIQYNVSAPRFTTYTTNQSGVQLYVQKTSETYTLSLDKTSISLEKGASSSITATASGSVTWTTANSAVATVSASGTNNVNATITATGVGSTTITAKCGTKSIDVSVTVTAPAISEDTWTYSNNVAYKMKFTNTNLTSDQTRYFTGEPTSESTPWYGKTVAAAEESRDVYFEDNSNNGHNLYFYNDSNVKTYVQIVVSGTHINYNITTSEPSSGWNYSSSLGTIYFTIDGSFYTLGTYGTYNTLSAAAAGNTKFPVQFELSQSKNADSFALVFLSNITCSGNGEVTFVQSKWTDMVNEYNELPLAEQNILKNAIANQSGTNIEKCVARYDAILVKYPRVYSDFMSRNPVSNSKNLTLTQNKNNIYISIVIVSICAISAIGAIVGINKKKEN